MASSRNEIENVASRYARHSLQTIDENFCLTNHDSYNGQRTSVPLKDYIKFTTDIKERNGEKKYFEFFC